jgi:hypothetical protein
VRREIHTNPYSRTILPSFFCCKYSVKNQDIEEILQGISIDLCDLEGELFNIKIGHEINMAPMKIHIEEWFKKAINKLTNEGQEAVETVPVTFDENDKRTSTSK